jgi:hypothetical protein
MMKLCRVLVVSSLSCGALAACSSSDATILALTIQSGKEIGVVSKLQVTVTPVSGTATTTEFNPVLDPTPDSGGVISPSFFHRITLAGDPGGPAVTEVRALDAGGAVFAIGATTADLRSHGATAAAVMLMLGSTLPTPDGGGGDASDSDGGADAVDDGGPG